MIYEEESPSRLPLQKSAGLQECEHHNHSTTPKNPVNIASKIVVPSDDGARTIGIIRKGVFTKANFHSRRHLCHRHNAIGIDKGAFQNYILPYARHIEVYDRDQAIGYRVSLADFESHCIEDDLGWGVQLFLPLPCWERRDGNSNKPKQLAFPLGGVDG
jgi:hypothetical protein